MNIMDYLNEYFPVGTSGKEPACRCKRQETLEKRPLVQEDPLEKEIGTYSSILAWAMPWTEEPGWKIIGHD